MMTTVETNIALAGLTTFGIAATAQQLVRVGSIADVLHVLHVLNYQSGTARVQINKHADQPK